MDGKLTRAGLLTLDKTQASNVCLATETVEDSGQRGDYRNFLPFERDSLEDSLLVNVSGNLSQSMSVGQTFELKGYRQSQIASQYAEGVVVEPEFNFKVVSGDSVVVADSGTNCAKVTATKNGVALVQVSFDAIAIVRDGAQYVYGATEKSREVVVVFDVGGCKDSGIVCLDKDGKAIESQYDTIFFENNTGAFDLVSNADKVECGGQVVTKSPSAVGGVGVFALQLCSGNNIVKLSNGVGDKYIVLRAKKIKINININGVDNVGQKLAVGDNMAISFEGLNASVQKMASLYNPCFEGSFGQEKNPITQVKYLSADGTTYLCQY
ncbi:MAG: hypothetical protein RR348_02390, partial [Clostridia bacterium]